MPGLGRGGAERRRSYVKVREAFSKPIGNFQYSAFRLADMATEVQLGRTFLDSLLKDHIAGKNIVQKVSMAKYWLGEMVNRIAYQAVQLHGGYGYMEEYRVCKIYRDVRCLSIFAGTSEIMKLIISRSLGSIHDALGEMVSKPSAMET
jgi:acyl-CoA dehydrogenase